MFVFHNSVRLSVASAGWAGPTFLAVGNVSSYGTTVSTATIAVPAGVQSGDLLLVTTKFGFGTPLTFPAGWTTIDQSSAYPSMAWKIAGGSETDITISWANGAKTFIGAMTAYRNVSPTQPIGAQGYNAGGAGANVLGAGLTTRRNNALVVGNVTHAANTVAISAPTTWNTEFNAANISGTLYAGYQQMPNSGAATDVISLGASPDTWGVDFVELYPPGSEGTLPSFVNAGVASYLANGGGTSISPALPGSRVNGNLLIVFASCRDAAKTFSIGAGWTIFNNDASDFFIAYRYVDGSETAPTLTFTTANTAVEAIVIQIAGAKASAPLTNKQTIQSSATTTISIPTLATAAAASLVIGFIYGTVNTTIGTPTGFTDDGTNGSATGPQTTKIVDKQVTVGGTTVGNTTVTGGTSGFWRATLIEVLCP